MRKGYELVVRVSRGELPLSFSGGMYECVIGADLFNLVNTIELPIQPEDIDISKKTVKVTSPTWGSTQVSDCWDERRIYTFPLDSVELVLRRIPTN